jgi:hypothetical protein
LSEYLTLEAFQKRVGKQFHVVRPGTQPVALELVHVTVGQCSPTHEQFSAVFSGSVAAGLGQGCFRIEQDQLGAFDLFLVPVAREGNQIRYEAVFNRFRNGSGSAAQAKKRLEFPD